MNTLDNYRRKLFLKECSDAYADLRSNKEKWNEEVHEREMWDTTLGDESEM